MKKTLWAVLATGLITLSLHGMASATTIAESGDAGSSISTAQMLAGGTDVVTGSLNGDADIFGFGWGGGGFYVNSVGTPFDSQLFLFDADGYGIQGNDDGIAYAGPAYLQLSSLAAGTYYLGISQYDFDPRDTNNALMFQSYPYENLYGPQTSAPLSSWAWGGSVHSGGSYRIGFASITGQGTIITTNPTVDRNDPVPEPATMLLMGTGLAGLIGARRKKKA